MSRICSRLCQAGRYLLLSCEKCHSGSQNSHILWMPKEMMGTSTSAKPCHNFNSFIKVVSAKFTACGKDATFQIQKRELTAFSKQMGAGGLARQAMDGEAMSVAPRGTIVGTKTVQHSIKSGINVRHAAQETMDLLGSAQSPAWKQLRALALHAAVPMVGFGIMDQTIMIQAGDLIDNTIGQSLALPTLAAAACGQVFSDFSGVLFGSTVEAMAARIGLPVHGLSAEQLNLPISKRWHAMGAAFGVVCGCLIGMTQMLFMDLKRDQRLQEFSQLENVFAEIMTHDASTLSADRSVLYLVDHENEKVWTVSQSTGSGSANVYVEMSWNKGISGASARTGELLNIPDAYQCPFFNKEYDMKSGEKSGFWTKSVLTVPVPNRANGKVFAVLQFINKRDENNEIVPFSDEDVACGREMAKLLTILRPTLQMMTADD